MNRDAPQRVKARAPGRVNLIGEHTDYNDGFVLPMALPFATEIVAEQRTDGVVQLESVGYGTTEFRLGDDPAGLEPWARYVAGMIAMLAEDGVNISGLNASISTNVPIGASLSSSAALEVASGFAICALAGVEPDPVAIAKLGQRVENEIIGIQSGIMDQLISAVAQDGFAIQIDCRSLSTSAVTIDPSATILILDTMTRRELVDSEYDLRRTACERAAAALNVPKLRDATLDQVDGLDEGVDKQRARHVVTENGRVGAAVAALGNDDLATFGALMNESHSSLSVDYEVSSPALDHMSALARSQEGCFGARMTGGGFAGSAVALVDKEAAQAITSTIETEWERSYHTRPDIWDVRPSAGASVERV